MIRLRSLKSAVACGLVTLVALSVRVVAEDVPALRARLKTASNETAIDTGDMKPWHLKFEVQLFDEKGRQTGRGTVEEWWAGPGESRVSYELPSYTGVQLHNRDGYFQTKSESFEPPIADDLLDQIVHPMPDSVASEQTKPDLRKQKFGPVELDCIMLDETLKNVAYPPLGLFPTYCFDPGKASLRISTEIGSLMFLRNKTGTFRGRSVALDIAGQSNGQTVATAHITALSGADLTEADFAPGQELEKLPEGSAKLSGGVMAGAILTKVQPVYPTEAKQKRITGSVVLHALIGRDGRIRELHVVSSPDASLAISAVAAVRQWTYKPYLLNGLPTSVDTTVTVNYAMSPN